jgi:hypothetical protein
MLMGSPVQATLGYVAPMVAHPVSAAFHPERRSNLLWDRREMAIHDAAEIPGGAALATHGFQCVDHVSAIEAFDTGYGWLDAYAQELAELARRLTGAKEAYVSPRGLGLGSTRLSGGNVTIEFVHNDYTAASIGWHVADLDPERAQARLAGRFAVYNMWRLVSPPPQSRGLAICDPRSVAIADLVPGMTHWGPPDEEEYHQNALFRYNPAHRWYWWPELTRDQVLVWAGFDSDPRRPSIVPHVAFDNPLCDDPDAYRTAVHGRAYVFFGD